MLRVNRELEALLPPLSEEEYTGLEASIIAHGCMSPIVIWSDIIVDGHHRYKICEKNQIPLKTKTLHFDTLDEAKLWAWQHQENRRNLTPCQRTEIALIFKPLLVAKSKKSQGQRNDLCPTLDKSLHDTKRELAEIAGVSHGTLYKAEYLEKHTGDETKPKLGTTINCEYSRIRCAERDEVVEDELEPMTPTYPNPMDTFQESVTLQHILAHDTESLITCLFSLFDASCDAGGQNLCAAEHQFQGN